MSHNITSNVNVSVSARPIQVVSVHTPIEVTVSQVGLRGPQGAAGTGSFVSTAGITGVSITGGLGFTGAFNLNAGSNVTLTQQGENSLLISATAGSSNLNGLITTGSADLRYLQTGVSGQFYPVSNPEHYLKSGEATNTNVSGFISTGSADLRYLPTGASGFFYPWSNPNNFVNSGNLENTGTALQNQLLNYYPKSNPNQFVSSGNLETTGSSLQNQITSIKNSTGNFIQLANLNGLISTGDSDLRYLNTGASGQFYKASNPNNFIRSGDFSLNGFITTGNSDLRYLQTGASGEFYKNSNPLNFIKSGDVDIKLNGLITTGVADIRYLQTGASGQFYLASNPEHYLKSGEATNANISGLITTGNADLRYLQTGASGNFYPWSNPNQFAKSGDINNASGALSERLSQTGTNLIALFSASSAGVSSLNGLSGILNIVGQGNISITTGAGVITVSGNTGMLIGYYPVSNPEHFMKSGEATNANTSGLISTGNADLRYLSTGASGNFYSSSNPNNFIRSGDFSLNGFISTGGADLRYIQTGASGEFYKNSNPNNFIRSGDVSAQLNGFISTGSADLRYLSTGVSGEFYKNSNPLNFIKSGDVSNQLNGFITTGNGDVRYLSTGASGQFYKASNPNNFISSGDHNLSLNGLITTGGSDLRYLQSGASGDFYKYSNPNQFIKSGDVDVKLNGLISTGNADLRYLATGSSGFWYPISNPNQFIKSGDVSNQLNGLITTGNADSRYLVTGASGQFYLKTNPNNFLSSGDFNIYSGSLQQDIQRSGGYLYGLINASSAGVSSINSASGAVTIAGAGNVTVTSVGQTITVSGNVSGFITTGNADARYLSTGYNISSINDLKNIQVTGLADNTIVYVRSYHSSYADQGLGGGNFVWKSASTSAEDSGRYISSNTRPNLGRWERLLNGQIPNVMMWGARGDASIPDRFFTAGSDDTQAIQKALDAARFGWTSELHFPAANYKITGTLYWDAQQTKIIGDGCVNATRIWMETGVKQDLLVSYGAKAILDHNLNPSTGTDPAIISITNDIPRIENIQLGYAGHYHYESVTANQPLQNASNSCVVLTLPGETNGIYNLMIEGGRYGIRILGPQGPGLRILNSTIAGQGDAAISVEAPIYQTWNGSAWVWATGAGGGALTLDNCSSDYRGAYFTGYSFVKVQSGAAPSIYIKDLKLEGEFSSGVINYQRPNAYNDKIGSIDINGLSWNVTQSHGIEQNMIVVHPVDRTVYHSVNASIKNCQFVGIDNVIKDYIAVGESGAPFIYTPDRDTSLSQQNFIPEINYQASRLNNISNDSNWYSTIALYKNDQLETKFVPNRTGWWRIMRGIGNASNLLNHEVTLSNYYGINNIKMISDNKYPKSSEVYSYSAIQNTDYIPVTRARFFHNPLPWSGTSDFPLFLDIFVEKLITGNGFTEPMKRIVIHSAQQGAGSNGEQEYTHLLNPIFVSGNEVATYSAASLPYCEVDLTRKQDRSNSFQTNYGDTTLLNKDFHAFLDSNRNLRFYDAGVSVSFNGGGGFAVGDAIIVNGQLKHVILSDTGNNYTSPPTITLIPRTPGMGSGALASGTISLNGGIQRVTVISGGVGYGLPPLGDNYGFTYLQTGASGSFYRSSNPNNFIRSGDLSLNGFITTGIADARYLSSGASGDFYKSTNPNNFIKSGDVDNKLNGLITTGSADLRYLLTGSSGTFYANSNPNQFIKSGDVDIKLNGLISTGGADLRYLNTGASGQFYLASNPNQFIKSGDVAASLNGLISTGNADLRYLVTGASGQFYPKSNPNNFISSGDVSSQLNGFITTGVADVRYLATGSSGSFYRSSNPNNFSTSGNLESTGTALQNQLGNYYLKTNPNNFVSSGQFVSGVSVTGGIAIQGALNLNAGANITLTQLGPNTLSISSSSAGVGALGGVTGVSITGGVAISGAIQVVGIYGTNVIQSGNTIAISGGGGNAGSTTNNFYNINSGSGIYIYRSGISSGVSEQFFGFPTTLDSRPIVIATLHNDADNTLLSYQISGTTTTGFWGLFSETTNNTGYYFDILASNSSSTGMAATVVVNNVVNLINPWSYLAWDTTTIWNAAVNVVEDRKILVMTGNSTLNISGLYNGWAGVLQVIQSGASSSGYLLTSPPLTKVSNNTGSLFFLTRNTGAIDLIGMEYDGINLFASVTNNYS